MAAVALGEAHGGAASRAAPSSAARLARQPHAVVAGILREAAEALERRLYRFEEITARFCTRSAAELLAEGHLHYATPCHDLCTLALARLRARGFEVVPVLCRIARWFQPVKFQCGLELVLGGERWYAGFSVTTNRLARGRFVPTRYRTHVVRARPEAAPAGAPLLAYFGLEGPAALDQLFAGHRLARHLQSYRHTTSRWRFARAHQRALAKAGRDTTGELLTPGRWNPLRADGGALP